MTEIPHARVVEVASIARHLTGPQRYAIKRSGISDESMATVRALVRKGLMYHHIDSPNGRCGPMRLTKLGEAVRDHLAGGWGCR
jgi:hypothetical protein